MKALITGLVLEVNERDGKNGTVYSTLIVFEHAQKYPDLKKISLKPDQVTHVRPLIGKIADLEVNLSEYQGRTSLYFVSARLRAEKQAA